MNTECIKGIGKKCPAEGMGNSLPSAGEDSFCYIGLGVMSSLTAGWWSLRLQETELIRDPWVRWWWVGRPRLAFRIEFVTQWDLFPNEQLA